MFSSYSFGHDLGMQTHRVIGLEGHAVSPFVVDIFLPIGLMSHLIVKTGVDLLQPLL